jgi:hypothetical protein
MRLAPSFPRSGLLDVPRDRLGSKAIRKAAQAGDATRWRPGARTATTSRWGWPT